MPNPTLPGSATAAAPSKKRNRHGHNRGVPPPPSFDFDALADGTLLSEVEAAAILRLSTNTLTAWRLRDDKRRDDRLAWIRLPNGHVRYTAAAIRAYLALGPRKKKQSNGAPAPAPRRRGRPRKPPAQPRAEAAAEAAE